MMGEANPQRAFFYNISLETFVPADHPVGKAMTGQRVLSMRRCRSSMARCVNSMRNGR